MSANQNTTQEWNLLEGECFTTLPTFATNGPEKCADGVPSTFFWSAAGPTVGDVLQIALKDSVCGGFVRCHTGFDDPTHQVTATSGNNSSVGKRAYRSPCSDIMQPGNAFLEARHLGISDEWFRIAEFDTQGIAQGPITRSEPVVALRVRMAKDQVQWLCVRSFGWALECADDIQHLDDGNECATSVVQHLVPSDSEPDACSGQEPERSRSRAGTVTCECGESCMNQACDKVVAGDESDDNAASANTTAIDLTGDHPMVATTTRTTTTTTTKPHLVPVYKMTDGMTTGSSDDSDCGDDDCNKVSLSSIQGSRWAEARLEPVAGTPVERQTDRVNENGSENADDNDDNFHNHENAYYARDAGLPVDTNDASSDGDDAAKLVIEADLILCDVGYDAGYDASTSFGTQGFTLPATTSPTATTAQSPSYLSRVFPPDGYEDAADSDDMCTAASAESPARVQAWFEEEKWWQEQTRAEMKAKSAAMLKEAMLKEAFQESADDATVTAVTAVTDDQLESQQEDLDQEPERQEQQPVAPARPSTPRPTCKSMAKRLAMLTSRSFDVFPTIAQEPLQEEQSEQFDDDGRIEVANLALYNMHLEDDNSDGHDGHDGYEDDEMVDVDLDLGHSNENGVEGSSGGSSSLAALGLKPGFETRLKNFYDRIGLQCPGMASAVELDDVDDDHGAIGAIDEEPDSSSTVSYWSSSTDATGLAKFLDFGAEDGRDDDFNVNTFASRDVTNDNGRDDDMHSCDGSQCMLKHEHTVFDDDNNDINGTEHSAPVAAMPIVWRRKPRCAADGSDGARVFNAAIVACGIDAESYVLQRELERDRERDRQRQTTERSHVREESAPSAVASGWSACVADIAKGLAERVPPDADAWSDDEDDDRDSDAVSDIIINTEIDRDVIEVIAFSVVSSVVTNVESIVADAAAALAHEKTIVEERAAALEKSRREEKSFMSRLSCNRVVSEDGMLFYQCPNSECSLIHEIHPNELHCRIVRCGLDMYGRQIGQHLNAYDAKQQIQGGAGCGGQCRIVGDGDGFCVVPCEGL